MCTGRPSIKNCSAAHWFSLRFDSNLGYSSNVATKAPRNTSSVSPVLRIA